MNSRVPFLALIGKTERPYQNELKIDVFCEIHGTPMGQILTNLDLPSKTVLLTVTTGRPVTVTVTASDSDSESLSLFATLVVELIVILYYFLERHIKYWAQK